MPWARSAKTGRAVDSFLPDFRFITREDEAVRELERFRSEPVISLDTETYYDPATKKWKFSLAQLAAPQGPVVLIDVLAVPPEVLRALAEAPTPLMVAHNARYDEGVLQGVGLQPQGFVDTLRLAQDGLYLTSYGLADVVRDLFGVSLDKTLQKSAWGHRPLSAEQLAYAAADAHWTLKAYQVLRERLEQAGRWEAASARASLRPRVPGSDAPGKVRKAPVPPLATPLTDEERQLVGRLKEWRIGAARQGRIPAYMVCHDRTLEHLARARPDSMQALRAIHGLGDAKVKRYGPGLLEALKQGAAAPASGPAPQAPDEAPPTEPALPEQPEGPVQGELLAGLDLDKA